MPRPSARRDVLVLCLLALALFLPGSAARDLWNPNEPTYGLAVAEMTAAGEWWIPTVNGEPFLEKPILYFWLARLATLVGGVDEFTLRLPSLLAGLITVVFVYLLGRKHGGRSFGLISALLLMTTVSIAQAARMVQMDLMATAAVTATVYFGWAALDRPAVWGPWVAAGLAAGLGFLAKGPVTLVVAAFPLAAVWILRRPKPALPVHHVGLALTVLAITVSVWVVPLAWGGQRGALHEAVVRQNFTRFLDPWDHVQPWWYFLKYLWIDMAPWAWLLPLAVAVRARDSSDRTRSRVSWTWLLGTLVFLSLSASKRSAYLMPAAPAVVFLATGVVERLVQGTLDTLRRRAVLGLLTVTGLLMLATAWFALDQRAGYSEHATQLTVVAVAFASAGAAVLVALGRRGREKGAAVCFLVVLVVLQLGLAGWLMPYANVFKSARGFAEETAEVAGSDPVSGYRLWIWRADYPYYLGRTIGRVENPGDAARVWRGEERHCLIVEQWERDEFLEAVGPASPAMARDVGSKRVELYCNRS